MTPVLLDTGVIVALLDRSEGNHRRCAAAVQNIANPLVTCEAVIAESCYLLRNIDGAPEAVLENVQGALFHIPFSISRSAASVRRLLRKYRDRGIDFADACLIQLAEELDTGEILTLDDDFHVYRWKKNKAFHFVISAKDVD